MNPIEELMMREDLTFFCKPANVDMHSDTRQFTFRVKHDLFPGLSPVELNNIRSKIGHQEQLLEFYAQFGAIKLYMDEVMENVAYEISHPSEWSILRDEFFLWFYELTDSEKEDILPEWINDSIVVGEPCSSGGCFHYVCAGPFAGKVFEFCHEDLSFVKVSNDFNGFLVALSDLNERLIRKISEHCRYSDGSTDTQWVVVSYESLSCN